MTRRVGREEGILVGISTGANVVAARKSEKSSRRAASVASWSRSFATRVEVPERAFLGRIDDRIEPEAWQAMVRHAEKHISQRMLWRDGGRGGRGALRGAAGQRLRRSAGGFLRDRPQGPGPVDEEARRAGESVVGVFHSHPNCDAYFSKRDLEHSCPWFSYLVLSVKNGRFDHAASFRAITTRRGLTKRS